MKIPSDHSSCDPTPIVGCYFPIWSLRENPPKVLPELPPNNSWGRHICANVSIWITSSKLTQLFYLKENLKPTINRQCSSIFHSKLLVYHLDISRLRLSPGEAHHLPTWFGLPAPTGPAPNIAPRRKRSRPQCQCRWFRELIGLSSMTGTIISYHAISGEFMIFNHDWNASLTSVHEMPLIYEFHALVSNTFQ